MSELIRAVAAAFGRNGLLQRADASLAQRDEQLAMAQAVAHAIETREALVVEAGTGVGKTFAYLVPLLLSGARAMVSTATKSLQDQLYLRDLPRLCQALNIPLTVALLKGRSSYLCIHRLGQARQSSELSDPWAVRALHRIHQWSASTDTGDLAELDGLDERSPLIPLVTSTRENCLGSDCPDFRQCHVAKARRDAMLADVVVVNHHLFFADISLRESGVAELLPSVDVAIFDEAHQLLETGLRFLGTVLTTSQLIDFARDFGSTGLRFARGMAPWRERAMAIEDAALQCHLSLIDADSSRGKVSAWPRPDAALSQRLHSGLANVCEALAQGIADLETNAGGTQELEKLHERALAISALLQRFGEPCAEGHIRWIESGPNHTKLIESPLDIRVALQAQMALGGKAWVFTSATLGDDDRLSWFTQAAGLEHAQALRLGSPFNYAEHARLYVPKVFPKPSEQGHAQQVAELAARLAQSAGGRCFVLTTTLKALQTIGEALRRNFREMPRPIGVLVQGELPKRQLLSEFLAQPRSVLVASHSFWEGIDIAGDALQCVLIDKLPFPPPNDPLVEARAKRLESLGRNPFNAYFLAEAAVALKQGAGRLIRSETDRGLLVICDPRVRTMAYGKRLVAALPPMPLLSEESEALAWLAGLRSSALS